MSKFWPFDIRFGASPEPRFLVLLAIGLFLLAVWIYRREPPPRPAWLRWILAILRGFSVALLALLMLEPVAVFEVRQQSRGRIALLLDRSASMGQTDERMEMDRKLKIMAAGGLLSGSALQDLRKENPAGLPFHASSEFQRALAALDRSRRWDRLERALLDPERGLLARLRWPHRLQIAAVAGRLESIDLPDAGSEASARLGLPDSFRLRPDFPSTDLAAPLLQLGGGTPDGLPAAVVLFSDGRHNGLSSPVDAARKLGALGIPVYTVGLGSSAEPADLGILEVSVPDTAYVEDRTSGKLTLKICAPARARFKVSIIQPETGGAPDAGGKTIWSRELAAGDAGKLEILEAPFEIPPDSLPTGRSEFIAGIEPAAGETFQETTLLNNRRRFLIAAKKRSLSILLIDGKPRWEYRFLKTLFQRDEKIRFRDVVLGVDPADNEMPRGREPGQFPDTEAELQKHEVVLLGDIPAAAFKEQELAWLRDLIDKRGAGLMWIAGRQGRCREYAGTPLGALLPVACPSENPVLERPDRATRLRLSAAGRTAAPLRLAADPAESAAMWELLRPQSWTFNARALPGTEVWVETLEGGVPVLVGRRYGTGKVLFLGLDETWRWRRRVGDRYHQRFWSQMVEHLREEAFAARDAFVAMDTDGAVHRPGSEVSIRLRLWNREGGVWEKARVAAVILLDGKPEAEAALQEAGSGLYFGKTPPLGPGNYQIRARVEGLEENQTTAQVPVLVEPEADRENVSLSWDEDLLRRIAESSGGAYLREENLDRLAGQLEPLSPVETRSSEMPLSRSWFWFLAILGAWTLEWILRKRGGLI